jgi:U5 small nuclear ribonucleoprotein component
VAIVGNLHHGKSGLMDMFVNQTHQINTKLLKNTRYTGTIEIQRLMCIDTRVNEQERKISLKSTPMSLVLPDSRDKSFLINLFDTPGHPNFTEEMCAAARACDGAILVVDCIEGVMMGTEQIIKYLVHENIAVNPLKALLPLRLLLL